MTGRQVVVVHKIRTVERRWTAVVIGQGPQTIQQTGHVLVRRRLELVVVVRRAVAGPIPPACRVHRRRRQGRLAVVHLIHLFQLHIVTLFHSAGWPGRVVLKGRRRVLMGHGRRQVGVVENVDESAGPRRSAGCGRGGRRRRVHRHERLAEEVRQAHRSGRRSEPQAGHAQQSGSRMDAQRIRSRPCAGSHRRRQFRGGRSGSESGRSGHLNLLDAFRRLFRVIVVELVEVAHPGRKRLFVKGSALFERFQIDRAGQAQPRPGDVRNALLHFPKILPLLGLDSFARRPGQLQRKKEF